MSMIGGPQEWCDAGLIRHFAASWLIRQAQKEIYSKARESTENVISVPESDSFRRLRAWIFMSNRQFFPLENQAVIIRKSPDGIFSMDENTADMSRQVGLLRVKPFGVYIINYGSSGDIVVKDKPLAKNMGCFIVASTKVKFGHMEGHVRIDGDPEDVQANINFARTKYPDAFCKKCKLVCIENATYNKLFSEAKWLGYFTDESIALEREQFRKFYKLSLDEIDELGIKYSEYLNAQEEPFEACKCALISKL